MPNLTQVGATLDNPRWNAGHGGVVDVSGEDRVYCTIGAGLCHLLARIPGDGLNLTEVPSWLVESELRLVSSEDVPKWLEELDENDLVETTGQVYRRTEKADSSVYILKPPDESGSSRYE